MRIFAEGLEWAAANSIELLVKLSRRFIPTREWAGELAELARASNAVTFSSYTTSYGYGFRTEATGMLTAAWAPLAEQLRKEAQPGKRIFVEQRLHPAARQLADEWLTASCTVRAGDVPGMRCGRPCSEPTGNGSIRACSGTTPIRRRSTPKRPVRPGCPIGLKISDNSL